MKLIHRVAYYLGGFTIGIVILFFFLGGKRASCDYGPNARTLKNIRSKEWVITNEALTELRAIGLDTSAVSSLLNHGSVDFSESNTELDSCKLYVVRGTAGDQQVKLRIENCEKTATVLSASSATD
jgi:hypothetical protein